MSSSEHSSSERIRVLTQKSLDSANVTASRCSRFDSLRRQCQEATVSLSDQIESLRAEFEEILFDERGRMIEGESIALNVLSRLQRQVRRCLECLVTHGRIALFSEIDWSTALRRVGQKYELYASEYRAAEQLSLTWLVAVAVDGTIPCIESLASCVDPRTERLQIAAIDCLIDRLEVLSLHHSVAPLMPVETDQLSGLVCEIRKFLNEIETWTARTYYRGCVLIRRLNSHCRSNRLPVIEFGSPDDATPALDTLDLIEAHLASSQLVKADEIPSERERQTDQHPESLTSEPSPLTEHKEQSPKIKPKKSTEKGEAKRKIISALIQHHDYDNGSCLNTEAITNNALARLAKVAKSTVSLFFEKRGGRSKYRRVCHEPARLVSWLKILNDDVAIDLLYGSSPDEFERDDE